MLLLLDNFDSFTYNVAHYFEILGQQILVKRTDEITLQDIDNLKPRYIVISPGPGGPQAATLSCQVVRRYYQHIPILGVCLGHQVIAYSFDGLVRCASVVMHGKTSSLRHYAQGVFTNLPQKFSVTRYHSLSVCAASLPQEFLMTAWTNDGLAGAKEKTVMGISHRDYPLHGLQFHPESVLSQHGLQIFENFLNTNY